MTDYNEEGLRCLAHAVIIAAVDDYTGMKWSYERECFECKDVLPRRRKSAAFFLKSPQSSLSLCCNILGADPQRVREGAESRLKHDLSKREAEDTTVRED